LKADGWLVSEYRQRLRVGRYFVLGGEGVKIWLIVVLSALTSSYAFATGSTTGTVCAAPVSAKVDPRSGELPVCLSGKFSFKIDALDEVPFSQKDSLKIAGLDLGARHRVAIYCDKKPHQTFWFRFSDFQNNTLCLFINDLYKTAQLWEVKRCPWCKCK